MSLNFFELSQYMNYRDFLKDWYQNRLQETKNNLRPYCYRDFSVATNLKSPHYLKLIIEGKRNLSSDLVPIFARALGIPKEKNDEFNLLVLYTQEKDPTQRNLFLKKLIDIRVENQINSGEIDRKAWDKIPNWVTWVLYSLADLKSTTTDLNQLFLLLRGKATVQEIKNSLEGLISSGELATNDSGELVKTRNLMEAADEVPVALVRKLQAQLMLLGLESLHRDAPTEREFGSLTMALTSSEFEDLRFKLRQMKKTFNKDNTMARGQTKGERVYQLNIQLFPVTDAKIINADTRPQSSANSDLGPVKQDII